MREDNVNKPTPVEEALAAFVRDVVRQELARAVPPAADPDPWVPHPKWPCTSRRRAAELARLGVIPAELRGKTWFARQSALDGYVRGERPPVATSAAEPTFEQLEADRATRRRRGRRAA